MSIWHPHYRSVRGPLRYFSLSMIHHHAFSQCSLLSSSGTTPTWPNRSFHNTTWVGLGLNWASLARMVCVHIVLFHSRTCSVGVLWNSEIRGFYTDLSKYRKWMWSWRSLKLGNELQNVLYVVLYMFYLCNIKPFKAPQCKIIWF